MLKTLRSNVLWGVTWGLGVAVVLTIVAAPFSLLRWVSAAESSFKPSLSFLGIIAVYLFGAVVGGTTLGMLRPILRWWVGRRIAGVIIGIPIVFSIRIAIYGLADWSRDEVETWVITAVIWGGIMSFGPEHWSRDADRNLKRMGLVPDDPD